MASGGSKRIKGVALTLEFGESPAQYECDVTECRITNEESDDDVTTFCDVADGSARDFKLAGTAIQSTDEDSLWSYVWDNVGEKVQFTYAPHGNSDPSEDEPHFTGTVVIGEAPEIGGEAGRNNTFTFEFEWDIEGKPTLDRGEG